MRSANDYLLEATFAHGHSPDTAGIAELFVSVPRARGVPPTFFWLQEPRARGVSFLPPALFLPEPRARGVRQYIFFPREPGTPGVE